jgi:hypothetical protein
MAKSNGDYPLDRHWCQLPPGAARGYGDAAETGDLVSGSAKCIIAKRSPSNLRIGSGAHGGRATYASACIGVHPCLICGRILAAFLAGRQRAVDVWRETRVRCEPYAT